MNIHQSYFERFYDSVSRLAVYADRRIHLLLENTYNFNDQVISVIDRFLKIPFTGLIWDIGYMRSRSHEVYSEKDLKTSLEYIKLLKVNKLS